MCNQKDKNNILSLSDEELSDEFLGGNDQAFEILSERLMPVILNSVSKYDDGRFDRDDLIQESRVACYNAVKSFKREKGASLRTYVAVCLNNSLQNYIKKKTSKRISASGDVIPLDDEIDPSAGGKCSDPGPEEAFIDSENVRHLQETVREVLSPMEYRILGHFLDAKTYEEIAESMGLSVKSVDNALQRVRKKLRFLIK